MNPLKIISEQINLIRVLAYHRTLRRLLRPADNKPSFVLVRIHPWVKTSFSFWVNFWFVVYLRFGAGRLYLWTGILSKQTNS